MIKNTLQPTILLVNEIHGINVCRHLLTEYHSRLYFKNIDGIKESLSGWPFERALCELDETISDGDCYIADSNTNFYRVEFDDGNIIAVHPEAEWCEHCEQYEMPPAENITVYNIAQHYISALIDGDYTGLTDGEEAKLNKWEIEQTEGIRNYHWASISEHREELGKCDIDGERHNYTEELHLVNMDHLREKENTK